MSDSKRKFDKIEDRYHSIGDQYHGIGDQYHGIDQVLYDSNDLVECIKKQNKSSSDDTKKHESDLFSSGHESIKRDNAKN